jgi:hypothetical protein
VCPMPWRKSGRKGLPLQSTTCWSLIGHDLLSVSRFGVPESQPNLDSMSTLHNTVPKFMI